MTAPESGAGAMLFFGFLLALAVTVALIPVLIVVLPAAVALGVLGTVGTAVASLVRADAPRSVPADDGRPADPVRAEPGVEPAWRHYLAGQARSDAATCGSDVGDLHDALWDAVSGLRLRYDALPGFLPRVLTAPLLGATYLTAAAASVGTVGAAVVGGTVLGGAAGTAWVVRSGSVGAARTASALQLQRTGAGATCTSPGCLGSTTRPVVRCHCGRLHLELAPGPYGIRTRRCACGRGLPTTTARAGAAGLVLLCPWCRSPLVRGAMLGRDVRLTVFGAPGAGTSTVVDRALDDVAARVRHAGGSANLPAVPDAVAACPVRRTLRVELGRRDACLHLVDTPASELVSSVTRAGWHHLTTTHGFLLVIDPTVLARIAPRVADSDPATDQIRTDPELAYNALTTELLDQGFDLGRRSLAVLLHKADLLDAALPGRGPAPGSDGIADWLARHGHHNLVMAAERDFGAVRYFRTSDSGRGEESPATAAIWLARRAGLTLPEAEPEAEA